MRFCSKGNAAIERAIKLARSAFAEEMKFCAVCRKLGHDVHEIARGASRRQAKQERCAWLYLCRECHDAMSNLNHWPIAKQAALKLITDPLHFDVQRICELRGRSVSDVTLVDVVRYLELRQGLVYGSLV
jgi:hypothetical protein